MPRLIAASDVCFLHDRLNHVTSDIYLSSPPFVAGNFQQATCVVWWLHKGWKGAYIINVVFVTDKRVWFLSMTISYHTYECSLLIAASSMYFKNTISIGEVFKIAIFKQWQHHVLNMSNIVVESITLYNGSFTKHCSQCVSELESFKHRALFLFYHLKCDSNSRYDI